MRKRILQTRIESIFKRYSDEEFVQHSRNVPIVLCPPAKLNGTLVYSTKPIVLLNALGPKIPKEIGIVGRYGLPNNTPSQFLKCMASEHSICYIGDMDSVDLLVFAWLRAELLPQPVRYIGMGRDNVVQNAGIRIALSKNEVSAFYFLQEVVPDLDKIIGAASFSVLESGHKIELEGWISGSKDSHRHHFRESILRKISQRPAQ